MVIGGIDAGGSATKCILMDEACKVLATSRGGSANYQAGAAQAATEIRLALKTACKLANVNCIDALGIGIAGAGRDGDLEIIRREIGPLEMVKSSWFTNDGAIAVLGAHGGKPGVVLIAGTGSIAYGLRKDLRMIRSGGWGSILGDEGSGYWIGLQAMKAFVRDLEGRDEPTVLTQVIKNRFGITDPGELLPIVFKPDLGRKEVAALAPEVIEAMNRGDRTAWRIIHTGLGELVLLVQSVRKNLDFTPKTVAVSGGLFQNRFFYEQFATQLKTAIGFLATEPLFPAVYGAAFFGAVRAGIKLPGD